MSAHLNSAAKARDLVPYLIAVPARSALYITPVQNLKRVQYSLPEYMNMNNITSLANDEVRCLIVHNRRFCNDPCTVCAGLSLLVKLRVSVGRFASTCRISAYAQKAQSKIIWKRLPSYINAKHIYNS
jgi:hypothetical protein